MKSKSEKINQTHVNQNLKHRLGVVISLFMIRFLAFIYALLTLIVVVVLIIPMLFSNKLTAYYWKHLSKRVL